MRSLRVPGPGRRRGVGRSAIVYRCFQLVRVPSGPFERVALSAGRAAALCLTLGCRAESVRMRPSVLFVPKRHYVIVLWVFQVVR
jgi:hypothetical protein